MVLRDEKGSSVELLSLMDSDYYPLLRTSEPSDTLTYAAFMSNLWQMQQDAK
jgi:hypothetical protein